MLTAYVRQALLRLPADGSIGGPRQGDPGAVLGRHEERVALITSDARTARLCASCGMQGEVPGDGCDVRQRGPSASRLRLAGVGVDGFGREDRVRSRRIHFGPALEPCFSGQAPWPAA